YLEVWLVNTVNEDLVASHAIRVKHVWDLVIYVELPVGDCQRQIESTGGEGWRIGGVIDYVHAGETPPYIASGNIHAVIMVELHLTALIAAFFKAIVDIGSRASRWDKKAVWLTIVCRSRVVAVVMHG